MTPTTDRYLISSVLRHFAQVATQIIHSDEWKKTLAGPCVNPDMEDNLYDAINSLARVADEYTRTADYQAAILEDLAHDNQEIARLAWTVMQKDCGHST